jgi:hypothetical protein
VKDADGVQTIRDHRILDSVPVDHGWRISHALDDYWRHQAAIHAQLGDWYAYEERLVRTSSVV